MVTFSLPGSQRELLVWPTYAIVMQQSASAEQINALEESFDNKKFSSKDAVQNYCLAVKKLAQNPSLLKLASLEVLLKMQSNLGGYYMRDKMSSESWNELSLNETIVIGEILDEMRSRIDHSLDNAKLPIINRILDNPDGPVKEGDEQNQSKAGQLEAENQKRQELIWRQVRLKGAIFAYIEKAKIYLGHIYVDENDVGKIMSKANISYRSIDLILGNVQNDGHY